MSGHILVVGSLNTDLVVRTPRHPEVGETIIGTSFQTFPGGKGANQAVAAARLGGRVKMIGRLGADAFGEALLGTVSSDGVDTAFVARDPQAATGVALITVDDRGSNTIVVFSGANARVSPEQISACEEAFKDAAVLLLQLECPLPAVKRAIELGRTGGLQIVLNPAPAQALEKALLSEVDYLIPNETELALLTGSESTTDGLKTLQAWGVKRTIVTLGDKGAIIQEAGSQEYIPAYRVNAVDTTAAGDAFVGAFAVALLEGKDAHQATLWGNAAGAISATRPGAQPSLPYRKEFDQFLAKGVKD